MSVASQIQRLQNIKIAIKNALIKKGIVADSHNMEDFAQDILDITTSGIDISDTTATASDVLQGKVFYDTDGNKTEGNIVSKSDNGNVTLMPSTSVVSKSYAAGYYPNAHGAQVSAINTITPSNSAPALTKDSIYKASANGYAINNYDNVSISITGGKVNGSPVNAGFLNVPCSGYFYPDKPNINISFYAADRVVLSGSNTQKRKLYDISIPKTGKLIIMGQCNTNCSNNNGYLALYDSSLNSVKTSSNLLTPNTNYSFWLSYDVTAGQIFTLGTGWSGTHTNVNWTVYSAYAILSI